MKPRDTNVSSLLQALRDADAHAVAPPRVEAAVLAAWDAAHAGQVESGSVEIADARSAPEGGSRTAARTRVWQPAGAIAAAATLAFSLTLLGGKLRTEVTPAPPDAATLVLVGEPIRQGEPVRVVRMRVPTSTLAALGIRSLAGDLVDAVDVDVIVGEDGVARAIKVGM